MRLENIAEYLLKRNEDGYWFRVFDSKGNQLTNSPYHMSLGDLRDRNGGVEPATTTEKAAKA